MSISSCVSTCFDGDATDDEDGWSAWSPFGRSPKPPGPSNAVGRDSVAIHAGSLISHENPKVETLVYMPCTTSSCSSFSSVRVLLRGFEALRKEWSRARDDAPVSWPHDVNRLRHLSMRIRKGTCSDTEGFAFRAVWSCLTACAQSSNWAARGAFARSFWASLVRSAFDPPGRSLEVLSIAAAVCY